MPTTSDRVRIGLIGVTGYATTHLHAAAGLEREGVARVVAYADPAPAAPGAVSEVLGREVRGYDSYRTMIEREDLGVVVIGAPIPLHAPMMELAFDRGVSVLVEKPPVVTVQDYRRLLALQRTRRVHCQVGFQTVASTAVRRLREAVTGGALGEIELITATANWMRTDAYYARSDWAGRLVQAGRPVLDGTLGNPLAHALMNCLLLAADDADGVAEPATVRAELYRCRPMESDDTSSVRIRTTNGRTVVLATTLCAAEQESPLIEVRGTAGTAVLSYGKGQVTCEPAGVVPELEEPVDRARPLADLIAVVRGEAREPICPLSLTGPYVLALNGVYESAGRPRPVPAEHLRRHGADGARAVHLTGIEDLVRRSTEQGLMFSELGAEWAWPTPEVDMTGYSRLDWAALPVSGTESSVGSDAGA